MRRAAISTFLFVAILGLGCVGAVVYGYKLVCKGKFRNHFVILSDANTVMILDHSK